MHTLIQGLWIGSALSVMERLSIASFLRNGHPYHLYVYGDVKDVPTGTVVKDAHIVLPSSLIFRYTQHNSYAGFSNFFRYKLLWEKGGWWADTDVVCLQPFDFDEEYVFATEQDGGKEKITSGVIKTPTASNIMAYAWQTCQTKNPHTLTWGEVGPKLMAEAVKCFSLERYVQPYPTFCPISFDAWEQVLAPTMTWDFDTTTYAIHLWNEMWRREGRDKNHYYHPDCLYEQLKRKYGVEAASRAPT